MGRRRRLLREELGSLDVVDAHEHLYGHAQCQPREDVTGFIVSSYVGSVLPYADRALADRIQDTSRPDRERWESFLEIWPFIRFTGYGRVVSGMLERWGLDENPCVATYDQILARLSKRSQQASRDAYRAAHIAETVTHYLAHPNLGGLDNVVAFLDGRLPFDEGFHPLMGTLPLHEFSDPAELEALCRLCDVSISSLDTLANAVLSLIERVVRRGVVGLKDHAAYTRGLAFGPPDRARAERELGLLLDGERFEEGARALSDYLFHCIVRASIDHRIPMVIHTGYLVGSADPKANARHFSSVLEGYPEARFDLYHLNYPWFEDLLAVLKRYPNTWANCCWTHIIDPAATVRFLQSALGAIPANHILGFGGDFVDTPEPVLAHLEIALDNIATVLGSAMREGWCSLQSALEVARLWLSESPRSLYGL